MTGSKLPRRVALLSSGPPISLKVLYCLDALGVETDIIDLHEMSIARFSRYRRKYRSFGVLDQDGRFDIATVANLLGDYIEAEKVEGIVGGDIAATGVLHAIKSHLKDVLCFPSSSADTLELLDDKWRFQQFMVEHGIPCPRSALVATQEDLDTQLAPLSFPLIAKPLHGESSHGVVRLETIDALYTHFRSKSKYARLPLLLQEYASGQDADISILADRGSIVTHVLHSRSDGCTLTFMHNANALRIATEIVRACEYSGVANIDLRLDPASGSILVLECNPRFWYTLQASLWRGLNFVATGFNVASGGSPSQPTPTDGNYRLHGCLLKGLIRHPTSWRNIAPYNWRGLFQALSDPLPFIAGRIL